MIKNTEHLTPIQVKSSKRNVRKLMGVGGFTSSGWGMGSYCIGHDRCSKDLYDQVVSNLVKELGEPQEIDNFGQSHWLVEGLGMISLRSFEEGTFHYVNLVS